MTADQFTDIHELEAVHERAGVDGVLEALRGLLQSPELSEDDSQRAVLRRIRQALLIDAEHLRAHPKDLFQCLYNRLHWFDAAECDYHFREEEGALPPWQTKERPVHDLAESWLREKDADGALQLWRSLRPMIPNLASPFWQRFKYERWPGKPHSFTSLAVHPHGNILAAGTFHGDILLFDVAGSRMIATLRDRENIPKSVVDLSFSQEGSLLCCVSENKVVNVWDWEAVQVVTSFRSPAAVRTLALDPAGERIAIGLNYPRVFKQQSEGGWTQLEREPMNPLQLWDAETGTLIQALKGHEETLYQASFSPDGRRLASSSQDKTVRVWDLEGDGACLKVLDDHQEYVSNVAFTPDGRFLAVNSRNEGVVLYDAETVERIGRMEPSVSAVTMVPGREGTVVAANEEGWVHVWSTDTMELLHQLKAEPKWIDALACSLRDPWVATTTGPEVLISFPEIREWKLIGHTKDVLGLRFSPDGGRLASDDQWGVVSVWDTETGQWMEDFIHPDMVAMVAFAGSEILTSDGWNVRAWHIDSGELAWIYPAEVPGDDDDEPILRAAHCAGRLATWAQGVVTVFDAVSKDVIVTLEHPSEPDADSVFVRLSTSGDTLVTVVENSVRSWNVETGELRSEFDLPVTWASTVDLSPDGCLLAFTQYTDQRLEVWDVGAGTCLHSLEGQKFSSAVFGSESDVLTIGTPNGARRWWFGHDECEEVDSANYSLSFHDEAHPYVASVQDGAIIVHQRGEPEPVGTWPAGPPDTIRLAVSTSGVLAIGYRGGAVGMVRLP